MRGRAVAAWAFVLLLTAPSLAAVDASGFAAKAAPGGVPSVVGPPASPVTTKPALPALFVENRGQIESGEVVFSLSQGPVLFGFTERGILIRYGDAAGGGTLVRARFEGANPVRPEGRDPTIQRNHYLLGSDPAGWQTNVPTFGGLLYRNLYEGIDLRYHTTGSGLKYEFEVAAGADPGAIRIGYDGVDHLLLAPSGDLTIRTASGDLHDSAPVALQAATAVRCPFSLRGRNSVGFECRGQDVSRPFTIDPLVFATFLGGAGQDESRAIAVDAAGNVYVVGETNSTDFPTTPGAYDGTYNNSGSSDAFVAKLDPAGSRLVYATFLGGGGDDTAFALAVDAAGNAFVAGQTYSSNFPTTPGAFSRVLNGSEDAFLIKLNPSGGGLVYSTLLGGSIAETIYGLVIESSGQAIVTGETASLDFPTTAGAYDRFFNGSPPAFDAFVTAFDASGGSLNFSTFLGGTGFDTAKGIALDPSGNVYVTGFTTSSDFPATPGAFNTTFLGGSDAFVAKLDPMGSALVYATYIGGTGGFFEGSEAEALVVDASGNAFIAGSTNTNDFPTTPGAFDRTYGGGSGQDAFVLELNATGSGLVYSTYLGGPADDAAVGIALDASARAVVAGFTRSLTFPVTPGADNTTYRGGIYDAFVTKLNASGSGLAYSTFLGGTGTDQGYGLALDGAGYAHVAGVTDSANFPVTPGANDTTNGGAGDAFVAKLGLGFALTLATSPPGLQVELDGSPVTTPYAYVCEPGSVHNVTAPSPQDASSTRYVFNSWSDGGAQTHTITCAGATTLTARYVQTEYQITVDTVPPQLQVEVDGNLTGAPYPLWCGVGSSHAVNAPSPQNAGTTRYLYLSWSDGGMQSHTITCDAPGTLTATFQVQHQIIITSVPVSACGVVVDSLPFTTPQTFWWLNGSLHVLDVPSPQVYNGTRYLFISWSDGGAQSHVVTVTAPRTYTAVCGTQYYVTIDTSPAGLNVTVDGSVNVAPYAFWCNESATIQLDVTSPQGSQPTRYAFARWSDSGMKVHTVTCASATTITAVFNPEYWTSIATTPMGLQILIDGANETTPYAFWCANGTTPVLNAPSPQGSGSTRFVFLSWSDGMPQSHTIACDQPEIFTATFATEHLVAIDTSPPGLNVTVDGVTVSASVSLWWRDSSLHSLDVPSPQSGGGTRYVFASWSDLGAQAHNVTVSGPMALVVAFATEYRVVLAASPSGLHVLLNGTAYTTPSTLWLPAGSAWTLAVVSPENGTAGTRYVWTAWSDGGSLSHAITVNGPMALTATFRTEYLLTLQSSHGTPWCDFTDCWYPAGDTAAFGIDSPVEVPGGIRYAFRGWSGNLTVTSNPATIRMDGPKNETASWSTQYLLSLQSLHGPASCDVTDCWYDADTEARFRVTATEAADANGARYRFAGWTGNFTGAAADGSLLMDGPKTVIAHWEELPPGADLGWVLFILPIVVLMLAVFLLWRRRRKREPAEGPKTEDAPASGDHEGTGTALPDTTKRDSTARETNR